MRRLVVIGGITLVMGCVPPQPALAPPPAAPREAKVVNASYGRVWDAVIERFAEDNIMIRTLDRSSGFIATEPMSVSAGMNAAADWADCGTTQFVGRLYPNLTSYNILVRGDSTRSTVKASIRWTTTVGGGAYASVRECTTTGNWEAVIEEGIAARAEGREAADVALRSLVPRVDTVGVPVTDSAGRVWKVIAVPAGYGRERGLEFHATNGEIRYAGGAFTGWQTMKPEELIGILTNARVLRRGRR